jgi:hypothetical protein
MITRSALFPPQVNSYFYKIFELFRNVREDPMLGKNAKWPEPPKVVFNSCCFEPFLSFLVFLTSLCISMPPPHPRVCVNRCCARSCRT